MHLVDVGMRAQPFRTQGWPTKFVKYQSQQEALNFLHKALADERGIGLLCGPDASGKSTLLRFLTRELPANLAVAVVDGARLNTRNLLSAMLEQFGYEASLYSTDEMLNMLNVLVVQQTRAYQAPVLILKNINTMYPGALRVLCKLAAITVHKRFALRIILVSNRDIRPILESPGMSSIAERLIGEFELGPLTAKETLFYLYAKLQACGVNFPDSILPVDVCDALHLAAEGWPRELDRIAMGAIERAEKTPVGLQDIDHPVISKALDSAADIYGVEPDRNGKIPKLIVSWNGKVMQEIELRDSKVLIGRSDLSDIQINDQFASKHHALIIRMENEIALVDLNSRNGTLVNSCRIRSTALRHNDVISLGNHGIKLISPNNCSSSNFVLPSMADTATMTNVADMRRQIAAQSVRLAEMTKSQEG